MRIEAPWLRAAGTRAVLECLAGGGWQVYLVGGCVRNALLGRPVADLDIATDARPEEVIARAAACGLKAVPTGVEHGTVTLVSDHRPFEVTTFRRDVETFGRHATVAFSTNIAEDAARRDFTMNALYATPEGEVIDPMGGLTDLRARRLRFVGDPGQRIAEDYLRILRFFRFHAWYGDPEGGIDAAALAACAEGQEGLDGLSRERVGAEITKLLAAPDPAPSVASMAATGILARVLPGAEAAALAPLVHIETLAAATPRWQRRLAALGAEADWPERLRLSRADRKALEAVRAALDAGARPAEGAYRFGAEAARDAALILAASLGAPPDPHLEAELARGAAARFPLRAADLPLSGPELGTALRALEATWIASDFTLDRAALLAE
ncbi:CCA tRNA nucleotidyltransferase [Rhodobacteraceae bacterium DSL-40]|uniref:CCA tRNA nucleotidyltransferase n=1 Tax=Amaricoccus sp. B4 TaxID=3368557 RepID=UPI000DADE0CC